MTSVLQYNSDQVQQIVADVSAVCSKMTSTFSVVDSKVSRLYNSWHSPACGHTLEAFNTIKNAFQHNHHFIKTFGPQFLLYKVDQDTAKVEFANASPLASQFKA